MVVHKAEIDKAEKERFKTSLSQVLEQESNGTSTLVDEITNEVVDVVVSDDFLDKLEADVGRPMQEESENDYLARAKAAFTQLFYQEMDGKK